MDDSYQTLDIPVAGGTLTAGRWGSGTPVIASHGITANHRSWQRVAELVIERSGNTVGLVAVDHRGRAGSAELPGPYGMATHADDVLAVADHLTLDRVVLTGHSMGGFVVAAAAERHPTRVARLVLVDGGVPFPLDIPDGADVESVVQSVIGPALDRLDQRWPDEEAYVDFFRAHPAFQPPNRWSETVEAYVRYDATPTEAGEIRSSVAKEAVLVDGGAAIVDPDSASSIERITRPAHLLWAPRGILDQAPGLYHDAQIDEVVGRLDHLDATLVADVNHYTIVVDDLGAGAVADAIVAAAGAASDS
ncbi:MAG: alpha/beta hydrolase [Actinomycetota bacterium]